MFDKLSIPEHARKRLAKKREIICWLYGLSDVALGHELLRMSRQIIDENPSYRDANARIYENTFLWHIVPEIARRLGAMPLAVGEATRESIVNASDTELRIIAGLTIKNLELGHIAQYEAYSTNSDHPLAGEILDNDVDNGNPVAFALDRLAPVSTCDGLDENDHLAQVVSDRGRRAATCSPKVHHLAA